MDPEPDPDPDPEYGTFGLGGTDLFVFIIYKVSAISFFNVTHGWPHKEKRKTKKSKEKQPAEMGGEGC